MTSEESHVERIFFSALERRSPGERAAYLDEACGADENLRVRLEQLLQSESNLGTFLEVPAIDGVNAADVLTSVETPGFGESPGTQVGRYTIVDLIGEGGFGAVYVAEQTEPVRRRVALKVLKPGMDTREVIARFEAERQALALMDHPYIARVLDAGATESGRPFFVMELVDGVGIVEYCDHQRLSTRDRLRLFVQVCRAVEHAHQKGVIHRDLKPSNILVGAQDGEPLPKIIDFGVAKAINQRLTEQSLVTAQAQILGTPLYMSPEQAEFGPSDVDIRSDIYSLGVILYELLTGTTPFTKERVKQASYEALRTMIREEEPPRPSTRIRTLGESGKEIAEHRGTDTGRLCQLVRDDLDWIVMKALAKDRARRYSTASALAEDVERHLDGLPVEAHAPSVLYRLQKFTQRHSGFLTAAVALLVFVLAGVSAGTVLIAQERNVARAEAVRATDAAGAARREREEALRSRNAALDNLYFAHMHLALQDWYAGNSRRMNELLDAHIPNGREPDLRGWEWYYLHSLCHDESGVFRGHSGDARSLALSPDGRWLASVAADRTVRIWDVATCREIKVLRGHEEPTRVVAWHPSGGLVASAAADGEVIVWEVATGLARQTFQCGEDPMGIGWSPNGRLLAAGGASMTLGPDAPVSCSAYIWDTISGKQVQRLEGEGDMVRSLAWSPNGQHLAVGRNISGTVEIWDTATWRCISIPAHGAWVGTVAWSRDGEYLASSSGDQVIKIWATKTWEMSREIPEAHRGAVSSVCWIGDGTRIASGSHDGCVKIWEAATGRALVTIPARQGPVNSVAWDPGSEALFTIGGDGTIRRIDPEVEPEIRTQPGRAISAWSPDGQLLVTSGLDRDPSSRTLEIFEAATARPLFSLPNHGPGGGISLDFSPDGTKLSLSVQQRDDSLIVWDLSTRQRILEGLPVATSRTSAWSPDGRLLASAGLDGLVHLVDVASGQVTFTFREHTEAVCSLAWSPDGSLLATGEWKPKGPQLENGVWHAVVKVWDVETGTVVLNLGRVHYGYDGQHGLCWSPTGDRLAAACSSGEILIWDGSTGQELLRLRGHTSQVRTIAWSPDGTRLASGGHDRYLKIWDPDSGRELLTLPGHKKSIDSITWSPDGRQVVSADYLHLRIWDASVGYQLAQETGKQ